MDLFAPNHLILIALIVLLLFGGKKIPELMRGLGRGVREFNDAKSNVHRELEESSREPQRPVNTQATTTNTTTTQP
jgi:sec-independent protein translocase protein TatA